MDIWSTGTIESDSDQLLPDSGLTSTSHQSNVNDASITGVPRQKVETRLYMRRWYLLVLFSFLCFTQGGIWNTFAPISDSSFCAFPGWNDNTIYLQTNWGPITYIIATPFLTWLMDEKGLRWSSIVVGILVFVGCGLRCITSSTPAVTWLMHAGQFLNGLGGPVAMGGGPLMSAVWFPVQQRTTATAFASIMNAVGVAVSFIIGPLLVPQPATNSSLHYFGNSSNSSGHCSVEESHKMQHYIMRLMYIEFGWSALLLLLILIYFPTKPPHPPSITASVQRLSFFRGARALLRHRRFWLLGLPYMISCGVYNCWSSVLDVNLQPKGISQDEAGYLGFFAVVSSSAAGMVVAVFADIFKRAKKVFLVTLFCLAAVMFGIFTFMYSGYIHFSTALLYSSVISGAVFLNSGVPLFFELCCEATYPIGEGITNGVLTCLNNIPGLIFFLILMIPGVPMEWMNWLFFASILFLIPIMQMAKTWMNWLNLGCVVIAIPVLLLAKERYSRLDIDIQSPAVDGPSTPETGSVNT